MSLLCVLVLCWNLDCQIHHWGVKPKLSRGSRDKSRSDFWSTVRAQLPLGIENRILDSSDAGVCCDSHSDGLRAALSDVSRSSLELQYKTCVQQHTLMENVLGEFP
eukprot:2409517-Amphidinium_carterae.1